LIEKAEGFPNSEITIDSSVLDIAVPDTSLEYPLSSDDADDWLTRLSAVEANRKQAFFGTVAGLELTLTRRL
jgi:hypothetical protein